MTNKYLKPNVYLNQFGLSMHAIGQLSGVSERTLLNWYKGDKRQLFDVVVLGCLCEWSGIAEDYLYNLINDNGQ